LLSFIQQRMRTEGMKRDALKLLLAKVKENPNILDDPRTRKKPHTLAVCQYALGLLSQDLKDGMGDDIVINEEVPTGTGDSPTVQTSGNAATTSVKEAQDLEAQDLDNLSWHCSQLTLSSQLQSLRTSTGKYRQVCMAYKEAWKCTYKSCGLRHPDVCPNPEHSTGPLPPKMVCPLWHMRP
jgi:hypothetical protein